MLNIDNYSLQDWLTKLLFWLFAEQRTPASRPARSFWISKTLGEFWRKLQSRRFATLRFLAKTAILFCGCVSWTKSELFSKLIPTLNSKNGLGKAKQFVWGKGFALPRLISRPQEGSGEECGRDFASNFFAEFWADIIRVLYYTLVLNCNK